MCSYTFSCHKRLGNISKRNQLTLPSSVLLLYLPLNSLFRQYVSKTYKHKKEGVFNPLYFMLFSALHYQSSRCNILCNNA